MIVHYTKLFTITPTITEFVRLNKTQKNNYNKAELISILESAEPNINGNSDIQTLISSITELTSEIRGLKSAFKEHQEATQKQFGEFKQLLSKQNEIIVKQQLYL